MKIKSTLLFLFLFLSHPCFSADVNNLFSAAILGKTERVKSILADGVDVNGKTATGRTAMMAASFNGNIRVVRILLAYGADVNLADKKGSTAIMDAVIFGSEDLVKLLITSGANVKAVDKQNISVLDKAKKTKYTHIAKILDDIVSLKEKTSEIETEANKEGTKLETKTSKETEEKNAANKDAKTDKP